MDPTALEQLTLAQKNLKNRYKKPAPDYSALTPAAVRRLNLYRRRVGQQLLPVAAKERGLAWKARPKTKAETRKDQARNPIWKVG